MSSKRPKHAPGRLRARRRRHRRRPPAVAKSEDRSVRWPPRGSDPRERSSRSRGGRSSGRSPYTWRPTNRIETPYCMSKLSSQIRKHTNFSEYSSQILQDILGTPENTLDSVASAWRSRREGAPLCCFERHGAHRCPSGRRRPDRGLEVPGGWTKSCTQQTDVLYTGYIGAF